MNSYITINEKAEVEEIIEKSKFISYVFPIQSEEEATNIIHKINKLHWKATHNVYAFILGENKEIQRSSDDGEPSGTAGVPVLEIIKKEDLTNILIIVTRYFGGIKLGAGGLIRAYAHMGKIGIEQCAKVKNILCEQIKVTVDYQHWGRIENECNSQGFDIQEVEFLDKVYLSFYLQEEQIKSFISRIEDITRGEVVMEFLGKQFVKLPI
ncbi:YigZ family protein [Irregularibacter muris]|uniref:YigZ family protein n=1 Tax=Irregularibacter muris TaxID=1796619 RepID=A0AAE3HGL0_9FIRM|nr:YigZ family protein [Irregularibacter muris]MCR1898223.1 YigZ family protein [Irregularibacter muris]